MAIAIAAATISSFFNFGLPLLKEALGADLQEDLISISTDLGYLRAYFLDLYGSSVATTNVKDKWVEDMKVLSEQMDDVLDCFMTKMPLYSEATGFLHHPWRFAMRVVTPRSIQISKKIRQLKRRCKEAHEKFVIYEKAAATASKQDQAVAAASATTEYQDATHVNTESDLLKYLLRTPSESEKKLMVISILGYGSLGNTLLVDKVYNQVHNRFSRTTRYNAAGKEVGLVIQEIRAQQTLDQNVGSIKEVGLVMKKVLTQETLGSVKEVGSVIQKDQTQETLDQDAGSGMENGLVIKEIRPQETLEQNAGSTANMGKAVTELQEILSTSIKDVKGKAVMENETGSTPIKDLKGKAVMENQETGSTLIKDLKGKAAMENQETGSTPVKDLSKTVLGNQETRSIPIKDLKGKAAVKHQATESDVASLSSQKDERYLLLIDNVDMEKLKAIINNFDNEEAGIIIVVTTDCTEAIHCKCGALDLDKGNDKKYMVINDLTSTISKEEAIFKEEIIKHKQKLQDLLVCNYKKSLSSLDMELCLLYFCMFPRHHLVRWNLLIRIYEAEGMKIDEKDAKEHSILDYLKIFIDHHAVHVSENGEVKRCQFPGMMLNHISVESHSNNFLTSSCGSRGTHTTGLANPVRRHSLHHISGEHDTLTLPEASCYHFLRTLAIFHTGTIPNISELFKYKLLRVLDMKECPISLTKNSLKKICNLLLLKFLSLGDTVEEIPRDIAKLQWLETFAMKKTRTVHVPVELMELPRLKHLLGKFQLFEGDINGKKRKYLRKTNSSLESLSGFVVGKDFGLLMSRMKGLQKLKIWCEAGSWTGHFKDAINSFTEKNLSGTRSLSIECNEYPSEVARCLEHRGFLTSLKLHGDLKTHLGVQVGPPVIGLQKIRVLCLSKTNLSGVEIVRVLKLFHSLEYLKLVEDNLGEIEIPGDCLVSLGRLRLVAVSNLDHIIISEDRVLCCLTSLHLLVNTQCDLSSINLDKLTKLKEITLYSDVSDKIGWQYKATSHPECPKVIFIQRENSSDEPSAA